MSGAAGIRAGKAFVEISTNDTDFQRGLKRVQHGVVRLGTMMKQLGSGMALAGGAMGLPMILAARNAATFEDALLELNGASNLTAAELANVRAKALAMSRSMGITPEKVAESFTLLVKAGRPLEEVLNGASKAGVEFARVGGVGAAEAAEFMADAINAFGLSAEETVNTLSAAADSSSTTIAQMIEGFGQIAAFAKMNGQSLFGVSQALAVLAGYGMKGAEASTGLKTVLMKMLSPSKEATKALAVLGLTVGDLVDETGKMLPFSQIASIFEQKMAGMSSETRKAMMSTKALVDVFDAYGIRIISAFADAGKDGFDRAADAMEKARTVSEKFQIAMSGISGFFEKITAAVGRLSIAFMVGAAPALGVFADAASWVIGKLEWLLTNVPAISTVAVVMAGVLFGAGTAMLGTYAALTFLNFGLKTFLNFGKLYNLMVASMTLMTGGFTKALIALRLAIYRIPVWGWALAGIAAVGGIAAWMFSGSGKETPGDSAGLKRDEFRKPLGGGVGAGGVREQANRGESLGTFASSVASQLGIGPALTAQEQTADNTARAADGIDQLVAQNNRMLPDAAAWAGMTAPGVTGGVAARSDRDLVNASERTAMASEETRTLMRQMLEKLSTGKMAFA